MCLCIYTRFYSYSTESLLTYVFYICGLHMCLFHACREKINMTHALHRRKLKRAVDILHRSAMETMQEKTLNEMDEYVMMLDSQRIQLVAKLKAIFDRFVTTEDDGSISGETVEQILVYMNRPIDSVEVNKWLTALKDSGEKLLFSAFVLQYCVSTSRLGASLYFPLIYIIYPSICLCIESIWWS